MRLITRQTKANDATERWGFVYKSGAYGPDRVRDYHKLVELGPNPNPDDVDKTIGNTSWTRVDECSECGKTPDRIVQLGDEPDFESDTVWICEECLEEALKIIKESKN